jgi:uncharacterized Zn finger protein (UPF0148 family)
MSTDVFKVKKARETASSHKVKSGTLDSIHEQHILDLNRKASEENVANLEMKLAELEALLSKPFNCFDFDESMHHSRTEQEIKKVREELEEAKSGACLYNYYLGSGDIMLEYYQQVGRKTATAALPQPAVRATTAAHAIGTFDKLFSVAETALGPSRKKMFDEYMQRRGLSDGIAEAQDYKLSEHCSDCNVAREEITSEGILVCPKCGSEEYALVVSDFPSFRDPPKERNNYAYKKQNHLNEILNQFQAKESTEIPEEVMSEVICEIKKRRIDNIALLTEQNIREILKKLNRNRYYEHAAHILSRLNGNPPPTITPEIEDKIRAMFQEVQAPYLLYCPDERRNFLSYSYIIYKFLELLELDEYKVHFQLLKSRDRLIQHDTIWKKICEYLQWEFIQSV